MVGFSRIRRAGLMAAAGLLTLTLGACSDYVGKIPKHLAPLDAATRSLVEKKGMEQKAPILIRLFKEESALEIWKKQKATGRYALLKEYKICAWSGVLGPKLKEGDRQAPEGFYAIRPAQMNPNSSYHLSFNIGFPNEYDRAYGRTGSDLMVHGACSSRGCYSMTDEQIQEIYTLGRLAFEGGQREFQVQAFPFRMTPENMAKHRQNPNIAFWRMLKEGYDHFEATRQPPKVDVCDRRYVFNSVPAANAPLRASSACPALYMPDEIRVAVAKTDAEDNAKMLNLASKLDRKEGTAAASMLAEAIAAPTTVALAAPMSAAGAPLSLEPAIVGSIATAAASGGDATDGEPASTAPATLAATGSAPATLTAPSEKLDRPPAAAPAETAAAAPAPAPAPPAPAVAAAEATGPDATVETAAAPPSSSAANPMAAPEPGAAAPAPSDVAVAPAPDPEVSPHEPSLGQIAGAPKQPNTDSATLEERMQAEASDSPGANAASAYAPLPGEDDGLTGFVLRMFE